MVAGDRLYVGNEDGVMTVLRAGRHKEFITQMQMDAALYFARSTSVMRCSWATTNRLYLVRAKPVRS